MPGVSVCSLVHHEWELSDSPLVSPSMYSSSSPGHVQLGRIAHISWHGSTRSVASVRALGPPPPSHTNV